MKQFQEYESLALFMLNVTALPQSTAAVENTFSKININKTKFRNCLAVNMLESIVKVSEKFTTKFDIDEHHARLHANARNSYMQRYTQKEIDNIDNNISFEYYYLIFQYLTFLFSLAVVLSKLFMASASVTLQCIISHINLLTLNLSGYLLPSFQIIFSIVINIPVIYPTSPALNWRMLTPAK